MSKFSGAPSSYVAELLAKWAKARSVKGKDFVSPFSLNRCSTSLKSFLDELSDEFTNNAHLDAFNHARILNKKEVKKIKHKYSFPN